MRLRHTIGIGFALLVLVGPSRGAESLIYNGSFDKVAARAHGPDGWGTAGDKAIVQELTVDQDPQRGHVARHTCTQFARHRVEPRHDRSSRARRGPQRPVVPA